ncbi:MAG TPA: phosphoribosyl-AMP cyclohydrolase [Smithella sp.]|jgi:phosphoribosyl-AMP cyclohydrolase|nr:phosphoribosyl-AMP cyclohydrolase [Smithella sp.]NMC97951.1 phosphoribosyl-AMP cyclohydrolase [Deltaproteobacteria bacterium]OQC51298.1 MAG: phosphoribosyl-AMP cyclohydrolase [Deltaproteobacteria bacterium ADurb.Bin022]HNQ64918.1 phosphoribosyl-AMP cyclohydrolase [Smithella sp.]HOE33116.1 phosphoribosyl-AMP cyclohydrolase [Smithella sp.]
MIEPDFAKGDGLIPAIVQDAETKDVLMMAYMNRESWDATLKTGKATYWSRSRKKLWLKGESSGNVQIVKAVFIDCDEDTILLHVQQIGDAACHTGHRSCFYRKLEGNDFVAVGEKIFNPEDVYK